MQKSIDQANRPRRPPEIHRVLAEVRERPAYSAEPDRLHPHFLRWAGVPKLLKPNDLPKYTEKQVRAYSASELDKMFAAADQEESELLQFLLCTGAREQEASHACWSDIDFELKTYTVTEHLDLDGWRPKDKEEGMIPIPSLVGVLKSRRGRYPKTRLIFPGPKNKPNGHMLRIIKALAL